METIQKAAAYVVLAAGMAMAGLGFVAGISVADAAHGTGTSAHAGPGTSGNVGPRAALSGGPGSGANTISPGERSIPARIGSTPQAKFGDGSTAGPVWRGGYPSAPPTDSE
jgi:hypothetical protein